MIAPKLLQDAAATPARESVLSWEFDGPVDLGREPGIVGDQDRLGARIMLGLCQQVGGDPVGVAGFVGQYQDFGRPGDHVDADLAKHQALCGRNIGIAGAHNLGHGRDCFGAISERSYRLGAADAVNLIDAGKLCCRQHQRVELAIRRRDDHCQPRYAGDLGRHRIHQNRRRIGRRTTGNVETDRFDCSPLRAQLDAESVCETLVARPLAAMIGLDTVAGDFKCRQRPSVAGLRGRLDFRGGDPQTCPGEIDPVKLGGQLEQRFVTMRCHFGDDRAHSLLNVLGRLALDGEKAAKTGGKIRLLAVQTKRHNPVLPARNRTTGQWVMRALASTLTPRLKTKGSAGAEPFAER